MKHLLRSGFERRPINDKLKWYQLFLYSSLPYELCFYHVEFADFVDEEGNVERVYLKQKEVKKT